MPKCYYKEEKKKHRNSGWYQDVERGWRGLCPIR